MVYETDVFDGTIQPGDALKVSANGKLCAGVQTGEHVIARAIAVTGGLLKFILLISPARKGAHHKPADDEESRRYGEDGRVDGAGAGVP